MPFLGNPRDPSQSEVLLAGQIAKFAESFHARGALPPPFHDRVAAVTRGLLIRGVRAQVATAARELHVSGRTLRRRLADEQTTFKAGRDGVLWEVVEALLSNRMLTVEAVTLSVGFADVAAFSNAFKRWAGTSPTEYRERLVARASGARRTHRAPRARP